MARAHARAHAMGVYQQLLQAKPALDAPHPDAAPYTATQGQRLNPDALHCVLGSLAADPSSLLVRVATARADGDGVGPSRWRPLEMARYDEELDEIELAVVVERGALLRYLLSSPRRVLIEEQPGERVLRVHDASGFETVIRVRERANGARSRGRGEVTGAHE
jgi:hypothetical protein